MPLRGLIKAFLALGLFLILLGLGARPGAFREVCSRAWHHAAHRFVKKEPVRAEPTPQTVKIRVIQSNNQMRCDAIISSGTTVHTMAITGHYYAIAGGGGSRAVEELWEYKGD